MAVTTSSKITMQFLDTDEKKYSVTLSNAKSDATAAQVKNLMDTMITKAEIFQRQPYAKTGAKIITVTETDLEVTE